MSLLGELTRRRLLVVTGKGGVGKSVISGALAHLAHAAGRRVLLLEADPRETQHALAGVAPSGGDYVVAKPGLIIQNLQPRRVFEAAVREHVRIEMLVRRVIQSPLFHHFVDAAPGLEELAILGHAFRVLQGIETTPLEKVDLVVLDAPATGHSVSMLAAPKVVAGVVDAGPFSHLAAELADFIGNPRNTGIVVVTLAEDMPVQEAIELRHSLASEVKREVDVLVVNAVYPPVPKPGDSQRGDAVREETSLNGAWGLWQRRRAINIRELQRLERAWRGPKVVLPLIPCDRGPALLAALVEALGSTVNEAA